MRVVCQIGAPYQFSGNRVIDMVELEGLEPEAPAYKWEYSEGYKEYGDYYNHGGLAKVVKVEGYYVYSNVNSEGETIHQYYNGEKWEPFTPNEPDRTADEVRKIVKGVGAGKLTAELTVAALEGLDRSINNMKGSNGVSKDYAMEHWVDASALNGKGSLEFNKYKVSLEAGAYSTSEDNLGLYAKGYYQVGVNWGTSGTNATSFEPKSEASAGLEAYDYDKFSPLKNGVSSGTYSITNIKVNYPTTPLMGEHQAKTNLESGKTENTVGLRVTTAPKSSAKIGVYKRYTYQQFSGTFDLSGN